MKYQSQNVSKKKVNAEEKKEVTEYLHKISSYLQIIWRKSTKINGKKKKFFHI